MFCSSAGLPAHVTAESLFCSSTEESLIHKIFVPSCAADGFQFALPGVLRELNEVFQLNASHSITFAGTGNAASGLTKHLPLLESYANSKLVLDSSVDVDGMLYKALRRPTKFPILVLQSQYDLMQLAGQNLTQQSALLQVEAFGMRMRSMLHSLAQFPSIRVISRACGTFGYVLPTKIHVNNRNMTHAGFNLAISRNVASYREIEHELLQFIETPTPALVADTCQSFLCNPTCQERIEFSPAKFTLANNRMYAVVMTNTTLLLICVMLGVIMVYRLEGKTLMVNFQVQQRQAEGEFPHLLDLFAAQPETLKLSVQTLGLTYIVNKHSKPILRNVSVRFEATKLHAIVGVSGGGKTTLLELLAKTRHDGIAIGEHACFDTQKRRYGAHMYIGLVKQQDFFFDTLTVMDHLRYVCCLKRPGEEYAATMVTLVINLFGFCENRLWECKIYQLSGGERKRLSIATQFVSLPRILLLDEPTSGLDANQAYRIAQILKLSCTEHGMTVIMTIHQARQEIFTLVDTLTLLFDGKVLVTGENPQTVFTKFGILPRGEINLADELMDLISSSMQLASFSTGSPQVEFTKAQQRRKKSSNAVREAAVLMSRTVQRGGMDLFTSTLWIALLGGMLICIVFYGNNNSRLLLRWSFEHEIRLDYVLLCGIVFLQGVFVGDRYWMERFVFDFERNAGVRVSRTSFITSLMLRFTMTSILETLAFIAAPSWLLLRHDIQALERTVVLILCGLCTSFQYVWVETMFIKPHDKQTAAHVNIAMLSASFLFNGFILRKSDLPWYLAWIPNCIASHWSFAGLLTLDLRGQTLDCRPQVSKLYCALHGSGDALLEVMGFDSYALSHCILVLVGMWLVFAALICLSLQSRHRNIWVLEEEKPHKQWWTTTKQKTRWILGLIVTDLLISVMYVIAQVSVGVYLVASVAFLFMCGAATWFLAANTMWVWISLPVELILIVFQSQVLLNGSSVIALQRLVRVWRIVVLLLTSQDDDDDEQTNREEEIRLLN